MIVTPISKERAALQGRIDSTNAAEFEQQLTGSLDLSCKELTIDAEALDYISSAGLRVLLKIKKAAAGTVSIVNVKEQVAQVLQMTGFSQLFDVKKAYRQLSVEGCEVIGKGFYGTVYRIDADTIVKVYGSPDSIALIENEQRMAKLAFLKGIPTAISYDIVRVGPSYGSVFEMLKAKSFNDLVIEQPDRVDEIVTRYTDFVKLVHATETEKGELPLARDRHVDYLEQIGSMVSDEQKTRLRQLLLALPDDYHVVHGDFQMKNVMLSDGEPMLIDMDTLAAGQPIFDLAGLYVTYQSFAEDDPDNSLGFLGMPQTMVDHIWQTLLARYMGTDDAATLQRASDKIRVLAAVRFLFIIAVSDLKNTPLAPVRIAHTRANLDELLPRVDSLLL